MVCYTRTDSVADLLSSTEGRIPSVFSSQRVVTIQKRCLSSHQIIKEKRWMIKSERFQYFSQGKYCAQGKKLLSVIFKNYWRKSTSFGAVFVLQNLFGRGVLSTVVNNAIIQMLCSHETALFEGGSWMCYVDVCFPQCHSDVSHEDENKMQGNFHSIPVNSREDIVMRSNQRLYSSFSIILT